VQVRLLVVSDRLPPSSRSGAGSVLVELIERLQRTHTVDRLALTTDGALGRSQAEVAIRRALSKSPDAVLTLGPSVTAAVPVFRMLDGVHAERSVGPGLLGGLRRRVRESRRRAEVGIVPTGPSRALLSPRGEARVLPPGVDTHRFQPTPEREPGPVRLLFLGRLVPTRGAHAALEAVLGLPGWAQKAMQLDIVGAAEDQEFLAGLRRRANDAPVRFLPDEVDVLPHLQRADLAVLPSTAEDGWGRAILEAMACGVPVVHSKGGVLDAIAGGAGIGIAAGNLKPLGERLRSLLRKPDALPGLGAAGREHVLANHAWDVVLPAWEAALLGRTS
jgi:glycosyltransferase involved in cell wall biosynthesis